MEATMNLNEIAKAYAESLSNADSPVNLIDSVVLPPIFAPVIKDAEEAARAAHQKWLEDAEKRGVTKQQNPNFCPYDELSEETKQANLSVVLRTYKIFVYLGVQFTNKTTDVDEDKLEKLIFDSTAIVHDGWSKDKFENGWTFSEERDDRMKHHTDLLDLETLVAIWPGKDEWDRNAVRGALESLERDYKIHIKI